eukprot:TRINITY_DN27536_c0_g1_i1.p1 TRINITY_DN27536_c0_g1~~TRINITY_DN27536_c0_g1_i1.p1  ORF type:complete len:2758 (+),score=657.28 TRINITY_DN27536_c0_g1_i1:496-8274(+)
MQAFYAELGRRGEKWTPRWRLKSRRALQRIFKACPDVLKLAATAAAKEDAPALLVAAVSSECGGADAPQHGALVDAYMKNVLEAKQAPSPFGLEAWSSVLAGAKPEDVDKIVPMATRMSKRQPAATANSVPAMASQFGPVLGGKAKELFDLALEFLKNKDQRTRARLFVQCVARRCDDPEVAIAVAEAWVEALKKTSKADEKQALLLAISAFASSRDVSETDERLGKLAAPGGQLTKIAGEDANEESRVLAFKALGALMLRLPEESQGPLAQELLKPLSDKKAPDRARLAALEALEAAMKLRPYTSAPSWGATALEKLTPVLTAAATKPVQRYLSLLAWSVSGMIFKLMPDQVAARLKKEQLAVLKDTASFANTPALILKAPYSENVAQANLWKFVLCGEVSGLPSLRAAAGPLLAEGEALRLPPCSFADVLPHCRTAVMLLASLRQVAPESGERPLAKEDQGAQSPLRTLEPAERLGLIEAAKALPDADGQALLLLLAQALLAWLADLSATPASKRDVRGAALREVLVDLCNAAVALPAKPRAEIVAMLAFAAHHPVIATRKWSSSRLWTWLRTKGPLADLLRSASVGAWSPIRELVSAARLLPAADKSGCREAALRLANAMNLANAPDAPEARAALRNEIGLLASECANWLHSEEIAKETEKNVAIFFACEGRLWVEEGTYVAEERENKNVKVNKFLKGVYGDDMDIVAEKKVAPKPAAKSASAKSASGKAKAKAKAGAPAKEAGQMTASELQAAQIVEQSETRARIRKCVDEVTFALDLLGILASAPDNSDVLEESVPDLVPRFMALLASPLTVMCARRSMRAVICSVVPVSAVRRRDLLPDALMVVAKGWQARDPKEAGTPGDTPVCETVLDAVASGRTLPTAALACVLPTVLKTLATGLPVLDRVCHRALVVFEQQLKVGAELPQNIIPEALKALGIAMLALSGQRAATQAALLAASQHLINKEEHIAQVADMFFAEESAVRTIVIATLAHLQHNHEVETEALDTRPAWAALRLGALDEAGIAEVAQEAMEILGVESDDTLLSELVGFTRQKPDLNKDLQELVAKAVSQVMQDMQDPDITDKTLDVLMQQFREDAVSRIAVARCFEKIFGSCLDGEEQAVTAFRFLLRQALAISDGSEQQAIELRDVLLASGMALVEKHGEENAEALFSAVQEFEDSAAGAAAGESARLGIAVFLGALSKHLGADHPRVGEILPRLLQRLKDPESSTSVQNAIVKVMPPLMKQNKEKAVETLHELLDIALEKKTHEVTRRGAAMGVGAAVKGLSIQAVSQQGVLKRIEEAAENKKDATVRQGALLCLEGLTLNLGRLFDPYVVSSLPLLLQAFSDSSQNVRNASQSAAKAMMSQLSGPGVKQVLKPLLEGIQDKQWRTKLGSIELLSSMTNCLPKQLAACLPQVVPALCGVINDQHAKVKEAAREAIDKIGSIISSPELRALAPELIEALIDGAQFEHITKRVLDQLLGTSFVHHIDAASLSLVCPLVQRALKERSEEMKRKGAQIVGSMVLLIRDPKDIQPYLPSLMPQLKMTLVDPIPDVRATAAKAFGTLANGLPEDMLGDVLPWLFGMLRSSESAVERSGAAHGLSEVLMAMGMDRIEMLLPDILSNATNKDAAPEVREGYLGLFVYLPVAMAGAFEPYLQEVVVALLNGVADDVSSVRDTAFRAAQTITKHFGASQTSLLLPPLEDGVFDVDWRIRHASVQLMGQLVEQLLRAHRIPTNSAELMFCEQLPLELRTTVLSALYIVKSDENPIVKQCCAQTWKAVVQNTPRTLKELLPSLMTRLISSLASTSREKQRVAARCVGDLVGKLGERVMPELMPIFMNNLSTENAHVREGVCIGLQELINATTKQLLDDYLGELIPAIQQAIIDEEDSVRAAASEVVALLHSSVGPRATTDIVTWVLQQLQEDEVGDDEGHCYISGLEQLMEKQPGAVLPNVLSNLTARPEDGWKKLPLQGLATIAVVPDAHTVHRHLSDILPVLIEAAADPESSPEVHEGAEDSAGRIMNRVEQGGLNMLFTELVNAVQADASSERRAVGAKLFEQFFDATQLDLVSSLPVVLPAILPIALADESDDALAAGVKALNGLLKKCKKEELAPYLSEVRNAVLKLIVDPDTGKEDPEILLPGLCKHGGLEPLYPIYQHGLMFGSSEARELAAKGLGELVDHTSEAALKPYVVKITGPLIRIVGDRFPSTVKKAIVDTLKSLLIRGGPTLKPFLPQLQTTYVKCIADPSDAVRAKAAESLGTLVRLSARTEPLINELTTGSTTHADPVVKLAMGVALGEVLLNVPQPTSEAAQEKILEAFLPRALGEEGGGEAERNIAAWVLALLLRRHLPEERALSILEESLEPALKDADPDKRHGAARVLAGAAWCQEPQMPSPSQPMLERLAKLSDAYLAKFLADGDAAVAAAGAVLLASSARMRAAAGMPLESLQKPAEKVAALLSGDAKGAKLTPAGPCSGIATALRAARHYGAALAKNAPAGYGGCAQLAAAAAVKATGPDPDLLDIAERAVAALLLAAGGGRTQAETKTAVEALAGAVEDKGSAKALREYASKNLKLLALGAPVPGSAALGWDF